MGRVNTTLQKYEVIYSDVTSDYITKYDFGSI